LTAKLVTGVVGVHTEVAPVGKLVVAQVAPAAGLGPLLVHVTVPVAVLPGAGAAGKPVNTACISACGTMVIGSVSTLLAGVGSVAVLPAVVTILSVPLAGAVNVLVHVIVALSAKGLGTGEGKQPTVAPAGKPVITHVGAGAAAGPAFVHTPVTVTLAPAFTEVGTVFTACISAPVADVAVTVKAAVSHTAASGGKAHTL
jgi:hypothetical protein